MTTRRSRLSRAWVGGLAFVLLTAGCGLKAETYDSVKAAGGGGGGLGLGGGNGQVAVDTDGDGVADAVGTDADGDGVADPGTTTTTGGSTTGGNTTGGGTNPSGGPVPPGGTTPPPGTTPTGPGTTTGVTATRITIGIHAPLTGASPLPQASFEKGAKNYWIGKKIFGREVVLKVMDDRYKPSGAIAACQAMARDSFIVVGGAGTDQIQACGQDRTLQRTNTPYISAGVTENGLKGIHTYFAASLTYKEQAPLVIKMAKSQNYLNPGAGKKWAVVTSDTPNFKDARDAMTAELTKNNIPFDVHLVPKSGSDGDAVTLSGKLRNGQYPVVYFLGQPTFFLKVVRQTQSAVYKPIWTGVGVSMGVNTVATVACQGTRDSGGYDGRFLSPYPGLDRAPAAFKQSDGGRAKDDIELTLWGFSEFLEKALLRTGGVLTRENFIAKLETANFPNGVFPGVRYSPTDHFGGTAAYALKSDCSVGDGQYVTVGGLLS
jgi:branched-chain amino acid transport system substrate-binding protein